MSDSKKTLVLGASTNPERYAYKAIHALVDKGHEVVPVGIKKGDVAGIAIHNDMEVKRDIDTLTLYIGPQLQKQYFDYILNTKPKRIIFNPGTENPELETLAEKNGIKTLEACTLVLLSTGQY